MYDFSALHAKSTGLMTPSEWRAAASWWLTWTARYQQLGSFWRFRVVDTDDMTGWHRDCSVQSKPMPMPTTHATLSSVSAINVQTDLAAD